MGHTILNVSIWIKFIVYGIILCILFVLALFAGIFSKIQQKDLVQTRKRKILRNDHESDRLVGNYSEQNTGDEGYEK